jgi:uncharacterized membrane protein YqjE
MANHESSIADLIKDAVRDARDLVHSEIALAKSEAREEVRRLAVSAVLLVAAAITGVIGLVLLLTAIAWGISEGLQWPVWAGFGLVTVFALIVSGVLASMGRARLRSERHMPRTVATLKEDMEWIRARTS